MRFPINFTKMNGAGNDFIIIDHRRPLLDQKDMPSFVRGVCRRKFSVGADGLIFIEESGETDFSWQFFNGDGSKAEMCGNGARCAARFAFENGIAGREMSFMTQAGIIRAEVPGDSVKIAMTPPQDIRLEREVKIDNKTLTLHSLNTGVPHAVILVEDNRETPVKEWGNLIRFHEMFSPAGANVNFVEVTDSNSLYLRTYERGVEDETLACGTGAVASAVAVSLLGKAKDPVQVVTSGGETLKIYFSLHNQPELGVNDVYLEGPARIIYQGELMPESLN
ncbi:MAG: diaminopimelate epimerase [Desulfurivibrionaceae bacterium]